MRPIEQPEFSPYTDNGGTVVAIAGKDYAIIASETRLSTGYQIYTRDQTKLVEITPKAVLGSTGCRCDSLTFAKVIQARVKNYLYDHNRTISTPACSQLISTMLYYKRFFPYYVTNILAGLNEEGEGVVYSYDPVGCLVQSRCETGGSSSALIQPFLDNRLSLKNINGNLVEQTVHMPLDEAVKLVKDVFVSAGERDIYVGDSVDIRIITSSGIQNQRFSLRRD